MTKTSVLPSIINNDIEEPIESYQSMSFSFPVEKQHKQLLLLNKHLIKRTARSYSRSFL